MPLPRPIVILGPTAGGKSDLAIAIAESLREHEGVSAEVLSADSMQIYRGLDAGTAKPSPAERARVPHHLIDIVEPHESFTVAQWLERADAMIADLRAAGRVPIVVGGTNLYIKALLEGMFDGPPADPTFRAEAEPVEAPELHRRLAEVDPEAAERIHPNDHKRLVRALEVFHVTGRPISAWQTQWRAEADEQGGYRHDPVLIGLEWEREAINRRINRRVKAMFDPGRAAEDGVEWWPRRSIQDETAELERDGMLGPQAREALGYKQVLAALRGETSMDEALEQTKIQTRRFARQQRTWLKRYRGVCWLAAPASPESLLERAIAATRS